MREAGDLFASHPPLYVVVERPTGSFPNPHLDWACGVVTLAVYDALKNLNPHPTSVFHVAIGTWKKQVVGRGNAKKAEVREWAIRACGNPKLDQDDADALAIATYAKGARE